MTELKSQSALAPKNDSNTVIQVNNVKKVYRMGKERILAVDGVSFDIKKGEFCCLLGTSGSGKSTLLNLMAGIERCTGGSIVIKGKNIRKMSEKNLAKFRQRYLGFVFQSYNLINSMTALENVELPLVFKRIKPKRRRKMARDMLVQVGLGSRLKHKPKEMSGGQQQRVGIARAFVAKPEIVFADEPTGNLDTKTTMEVMKLIKQISRDNNQTIVMVTHDPRLAAFADKIIHILDGCIQEIEICDHSADVDENTENVQMNDVKAAVLAETKPEDEEQSMGEIPSPEEKLPIGDSPSEEKQQTEEPLQITEEAAVAEEGQEESEEPDVNSEEQADTKIDE